MLFRLRAIGLLCLLLALTSCGRWSPDRYEQAAASHLDTRLEQGLSVAEFEARFPGAVPLERNDRQQRFFVSHHEVCLLCRSGHGFLLSEDQFGRVAVFEAGRLVAVEPVYPGNAK